jgi:2-polyprenyl-6-methoxyphenol hydroxylase-like FAD-dependent oxidoreductase
VKVIIAGGGIGGLVTALSLHRAAIDVHVFESASALHPLGVGINLLPHCTRHLAELGALAPLLELGVETGELVFFNKFGQRVWEEPRGIAAGYRYPQVAIHRGELQMALFELVQERVGRDHVHTGHHLVDFDIRDDGVTAQFADHGSGGTIVRASGDLLIGADGIHSMVRAKLAPREGAPKWSGGLIWRGVTETAPFLSGRTQIAAGGRQTFIAYPMSKPYSERGRSLTNWAARFFVEPSRELPPEDWNRPGKLEDFLPRYEDWRFDWLDIPSVIRSAQAIYEFPLVDRDPLERWTFGRVTLLGDAAHPMYPLGSNGASQAILDARSLAAALRDCPTIDEALHRYEDDRRNKTAEIVARNRQGGPEIVIRIAEERAPNGFADIEAVIPRNELTRIAESYKQIASFDRETVNG